MESPPKISEGPKEVPIEVLRASVLVDRRDVPRVDRALDELARNRARDMLFKYLGPLPPHSFVSLRFGAG